MYFWYYYQETEICYDDVEKSIFGKGVCKDWAEMLDDIVNFVFELKIAGDSYRIDYSKFYYIHQHDFQLKTLHKNEINYIADKAELLYNNYYEEENNRRRNREKYKKIKTSIDTIKSVNRDISDEELMNILKISREVLDEYYAPPF